MNMFKTMMSAAGILLLAGSLAAQIEVGNNDKIAFLGDSITWYGNVYATGYVNLVMSGLEANEIHAEKIPAGIGGHTSVQMLERLERDVLDKKPQIMILSCGVNDVGPSKHDVPLPDYKKNITAIVEKAQSAGIKVCILTATMVGEDPNHSNNVKLSAYNDFLRELAKEKKCLLADLNAEMQQSLKSFKSAHPKAKGNLLTIDGVHMNPCGDIMMAKGVLRAFGLKDEQISKVETDWKKLKGKIGELRLSSGDLQKLAIRAADSGMTISDYAAYLITNAISTEDQK